MTQIFLGLGCTTAISPDAAALAAAQIIALSSCKCWCRLRGKRLGTLNDLKFSDIHMQDELSNESQL